MFYDLIAQDPQYGLDDAMAVIWDNFDTDFRSYWGLDCREPPEHLDWDEWRCRVEVAQLVERIARGVSALVRPPKTRDDQLQHYGALRDEALRVEATWEELHQKLKLVVPEEEHWKLAGLQSEDLADPRNRWAFMRNCMQLAAFHLYWEDPSTRADRVFELLPYVMRKPGQRCREYLPRVAECYVRGLRVELAVMTRAVMDAALQDTFTDDQVRTRVGADKYVSLERRIEHARSVAAFDMAAYDAANRVRDAGNAAAHADLEAEPDPDRLVADLHHCLAALDHWDAQR